MFKTRWFPLLCFTLLVGCDDDKDTGDTAPAANTAANTGGNTGAAPGAYASDYATSADFFTLMSGPAAGASPHGTVQIWYSTNLRSMIEAGGGFTAPEGSVSIKTFDNGDTGTVVMVKKEAGFDTDNNDWYYEMRGADDSVMDSGAIEMCIGCHSAASATDYLAGTTLR